MIRLAMLPNAISSAATAIRRASVLAARRLTARRCDCRVDHLVDDLPNRLGVSREGGWRLEVGDHRRVDRVALDVFRMQMRAHARQAQHLAARHIEANVVAQY